MSSSQSRITLPRVFGGTHFNKKLDVAKVGFSEALESNPAEEVGIVSIKWFKRSWLLTNPGPL
jgi:hypothetical protein